MVMVEHVDPASCAGPRHIRWRGRTISLLIRLYLLALAPALVGLFAVAIDPGFAETVFSFAPGDSAMSGFSGTVLSLPSLPPGVSPIDKTVIDVDAPSLSVFDLSTLGGAPQGRAISPAVKLSIKAKEAHEEAEAVQSYRSETTPSGTSLGDLLKEQIESGEGR